MISANGDTKSATTPLVKRTKLCRDFVTSIDQTGELIALFADSLFDEVKKERDQVSGFSFNLQRLFQPRLFKQVFFCLGSFELQNLMAMMMMLIVCVLWSKCFVQYIESFQAVFTF